MATAEKTGEVWIMKKNTNKTCPKCGKYVRNTGENANISMEDTPQEKRRHAEGWCPKGDK